VSHLELIERPGPYAKMTTEDFDRCLYEVIANDDLMLVPGVYEAVSEHYHNEVLEAWKDEQEDSDGKEHNG
jgi:hypothetical protein